MTNLKFKKFDIDTYKPGESNLGKMKKIIKLSANESALGASPRVKRILSNGYFYHHPLLVYIFPP